MIGLRKFLKFSLIALVSCSASPQERILKDKSSQRALIPLRANNLAGQYDYKSPSATYVLDAKLEEISGLAYNELDNTFLANDDESGNFYVLSSTDLSIIEEIKFSKKGDFESIEKVGDDIIIGKNTGTFYFYNLITKTAAQYKTELKAKNDVEGSCYFESEHALLIACKGQSLQTQKGEKKKKSIYSFDLKNKTLDPQPFLTINDEMLISHIEKHYVSESISKLRKLKNRAKEHAPSGIAIHPRSGEYYIVSARGSTLVVLDNNKVFKEINFLNSRIIPQPEGICFDKNGNLFIATEGQGFSGKVFKFETK